MEINSVLVFKDPFKEHNSTLLNPQSNHQNDDNNENLLLDDLMDIIDCKWFKITLYFNYVISLTLNKYRVYFFILRCFKFYKIKLLPLYLGYFKLIIFFLSTIKITLSIDVKTLILTAYNIFTGTKQQWFNF